MGWTSAAELAGPGLEDALADCGRSLGTDRRDIQGQRLVELVAWQFALPLAHALLDGEAPPAVTRVWIGGEPPDPILDGTHRSVDAWREDAHTQLEPLIASVNAATLRPRKALWRGARDRFAGAVVWIAQTTGREERACDLARAVVAAAEVRDFNGGVLHVREGCCLYYRIPGTLKCWSCPLLTDDERRALVAG